MFWYTPLPNLHRRSNHVVVLNYIIQNFIYELVIKKLLIYLPVKQVSKLQICYSNWSMLIISSGKLVDQRNRISVNDNPSESGCFYSLLHY